MLTLIMDRSSMRPQMTVRKDGATILQHLWTEGLFASQRWMRDVQTKLAEAQIFPAEIDRFVCGIGPGSFSGIRACLSALVGMSLPQARPVFGIASSAAIALAEANGHSLVSVVGDARRDRMWLATYKVDAATNTVTLRDDTPPTHTASDFLLCKTSELRYMLPEDSFVVSPDWTRLEKTLRASLPEERLLPRAVFPSAEALALIAESTPGAMLQEPLPIYLQPPVADKTA